MMKVGVVMGGMSSEREISLMTGKEMLARLDRSKYEVVPIEIVKQEDLSEQVQGIDFALLALHGAYGEDGTVQAALESLSIPYSGSGVESSALCMDKNRSKQLLRAAGIPTPDWLCWSGMEEYDAEAVAQLGYPVFVKPNSGGSSVGTLPVSDEASLKAAVQEALRWDSSVLIEQLVEGEEITCSIVGEDLLPVIGIRSKASAWFDYHAKYQDGGAEEQVVILPTEIQTSVQDAAISSYRILKCSVCARVDMILRNGIPYVLEVNTLPGMTPNSLLPKSAQAAGLKFNELLDRIIELSLQEREQNGIHNLSLQKESVTAYGK